MVQMTYMLPAKSAVGVVATRQPAADENSQAIPPRDILLLHPDGRLGLYVGSQPIATVALDLAPSAAATARSHMISRADTDASSPTGGPLSMVLPPWCLYVTIYLFIPAYQAVSSVAVVRLPYD